MLGVKSSRKDDKKKTSKLMEDKTPRRELRETRKQEMGIPGLPAVRDRERGQEMGILGLPALKDGAPETATTMAPAISLPSQRTTVATSMQSKPTPAPAV